jgi:hypothetical protein
MGSVPVPSKVAPVVGDAPLAGDPRLAGIEGGSTSRRRSRARIFGPRRERLWLAGALAFTLLFTARSMAPAFGARDAIQDDAVQHVFWTLRYRDPELFRDDLYADYFGSLAPPVYAAVYGALARAVDPLLANKLLPPILGAVTALFTFLFVRRLHPSPGAAFLATILLSWYVWQLDDLASATPRAFLLPTLAALLWALAAGRLILFMALPVLAALLYPAAGALAVALLGVRLVRLKGRPRLVLRRRDWLAFLAAASLVAIALAPSLVAGSSYGPAVTASQARTMPEFGPNGRNAYFVDDAYQFWLESNRSGLNARVSDAVFPAVPVLLEYAVLAALLPLVLLLRRRLPAARLVDRRAAILVQLLAASLALFFLAHALLFRLYLPARYVQWSLPLVLSVAAGLALAILSQEAAARLRPARTGPIAAALAFGFAGGVALYPGRYHGNFVRDAHPEITAFLRAQPKDVLVAALPRVAGPLSALSGRRILVAQEYALAYHLGYYGEVRQRTNDLIDAYYDEGTTRLAALVERYGVDFFLVDDDAFDATTFRRVWRRSEPFTSAIAARLDRPQQYTLQDLARRCTAVRDGTVALIPAGCLSGAR